MENLEMWNVVVGAVMPVLVGIVVQSHWSQGLRAFVGVLCSLVAGAITYGITHNWSWSEDFITNCLGTLIAAGAVLSTFWKPTGIYDDIVTKTTPNNDANRAPRR